MITKKDIIFQKAGTVSNQDFWFIILPSPSDFIYNCAVHNDRGYCFWADYIVKEWEKEPSQKEIDELNKDLEFDCVA